MKIKIKCGLCRSESLLVAEKVMSLDEAKDVIDNITEVISKHNKHSQHLEFAVFESEEDETTQRYVLDEMRRKADNELSI